MLPKNQPNSSLSLLTICLQTGGFACSDTSQQARGRSEHMRMSRTFSWLHDYWRQHKRTFILVLLQSTAWMWSGTSQPSVGFIQFSSWEAGKQWQAGTTMLHVPGNPGSVQNSSQSPCQDTVEAVTQPRARRARPTQPPAGSHSRRGSTRQVGAIQTPWNQKLSPLAGLAQPFTLGDSLESTLIKMSTQELLPKHPSSVCDNQSTPSGTYYIISQSGEGTKNPSSGSQPRQEYLYLINLCYLLQITLETFHLLQKSRVPERSADSTWGEGSLTDRPSRCAF